MRDIQFRGKDYGNDWQYGYLVQEVWGQDKILMIKKNKREVRQKIQIWIGEVEEEEKPKDCGSATCL